MAAALVLAQLRAQMALPMYAAAPTLGLLYITDHYANEARALLDYLASELPEVMHLAHRTVVMRRGRMVATFEQGEADAETIVAAASGIASGVAHDAPVHIAAPQELAA